MPDAKLGFAYSKERAVDDFVFMCMLVGNDFIPSLPHLEVPHTLLAHAAPSYPATPNPVLTLSAQVADGALNLMVQTYKNMLPSLGGFITDKSRHGGSRVGRGWGVGGRVG